MSMFEKDTRFSGLNGENDTVSPEQYGLPKSSAQQKLSPLDMNMPRLYDTRWILCFSLPANVDKAEIYESLKLGLAHTISTIPWIAGNVGPEEGRDPKEGRIQVVNGSGGVKFLYKDLTGILPSYAELKVENFPISKLSTAQLSPLGVMPEPPQPVMAAQANFIEGGLLLTIGVHHSICDGSAVDTILDTWASNTTASASGGSTSFTVYDSTSNDRTPLMTGHPGADLAEFPEYILMPTAPTTVMADVNTHQIAAMPTTLPPMTSHIFYFSSASLTALKAAASAFSTNDALCAFLWQHMTLARNPTDSSRVEKSTKTSSLLFSVNIRGRTSPPLPPTYLGNASMAVITDHFPISLLTVTAADSDSALSRAAAAIRRSLNAVNTPNRVPLTIGLIDSRPNPTDYKFAYNGFLGPDISATSWADFGVYKREWGGLLGKVEAFRVPGEGADGVVVVFPRTEEGGLEVMVGLEDGAMGRLMGDVRFIESAKLRG
ncbi:hypothetical protein GX50_06218 [[Emmonsia] crescens]|uniref:Trichothecene 3-O-acetyltransferase n=1 Tax=[Emmonsia] crescens TaxID=73230 RepID=A0A2B7Z3R8_9EURO|nr:hypothetical protein GX50_06218 [Emmonsia crescens]